MYMMEMTFTRNPKTRKMNTVMEAVPLDVRRAQRQFVEPFCRDNQQTSGNAVHDRVIYLASPPLPVMGAHSIECLLPFLDRVHTAGPIASLQIVNNYTTTCTAGQNCGPVPAACAFPPHDHWQPCQFRVRAYDKCGNIVGQASEAYDKLYLEVWHADSVQLLVLTCAR
jgi:hypothetical protein